MWEPQAIPGLLLGLELCLGKGESPPPGPFGLRTLNASAGLVLSSGRAAISRWKRSTWAGSHPCSSPLSGGPAYRLCLLGEPLGEPLAGEPLGDPLPWEPLLRPLNMVAKAGAGSGWARPVQAGGGQQACVLAGGSAGLWRGGVAGHREGSFWEAPPRR